MADSDQKLLVTGASGMFGKFVLSELSRHRFEVLATDRVEEPESPFPIHLTNLLDLPDVRKLMPGVDTVIHLGNHAYQRKNEITYNENAAMNMNVFQAAVDHGVRKIIFASSVQVIGSEGGDVPIDRAARFPSFPLDGDTPPFPTNTYAVSKRAGEILTEYFATCYDIQGIAIRFPGMCALANFSYQPDWNPHPAPIRQGFSYLSYEDASRFVVAVIRAQLPGFRIYFPSSVGNRNGLLTSRLLKEFYPGIPCRRTITDQEGLVDISRITRETGWEPEDVIGPE
jgi:nucleoside-diphosphate-sugar epimerase